MPRSMWVGGFALLLTSTLYALTPADRHVQRRSAAPSEIDSASRARPSVAGRSAIRGRVVVGGKGAPLRRARVTCTGPSLDEPRVEVTDVDGRYEMQGLPAGRYWISATRAGYARAAFGTKRTTTQGAPIDLGDAEAFERADLELLPGGVIAGRIVDEWGDPLVDVTVTAGRATPSSAPSRFIGLATTLTDDEGRYRLWGLPAGAYYILARPDTRRVIASLAETLPRATFYPGAPGLSLASTVSVEDAQEISDVDFVVGTARLAAVFGTILGSNGQPVSQTRLAIASVGEDARPARIIDGVRPNRDGTFLLRNLSPGDYELVATLEGSGAVREVGTMRLSLQGQDVHGLAITLTAASRIAGVLRSDSGALTIPPTSLRIAAVPLDRGVPTLTAPVRPGAVPPAADAAEGTFELGIPPGPRILRVTGLPAGWGVLSIADGARDLTGAPIDLPAGTDLRTLQIIVTRRLAELSGEIVEKDGRPAPASQAVIFAKDPARWSASDGRVRTERANQIGRFRVRGLRPGEYVAAATDEGFDVEAADASVLEKLRAHAVPIVLPAGGVQTVTLVVAAPNR